MKYFTYLKHTALDRLQVRLNVILLHQQLAILVLFYAFEPSHACRRRRRNFIYHYKWQAVSKDQNISKLAAKSRRKNMHIAKKTYRKTFFCTAQTLVCQQTSPRRAQQRPVRTIYQRMDPISRTKKNISSISLIPPLIFTGSKSAKFGVNLAFEAL